MSSINQISVDSRLRISNINVFALCFADGLLLPKEAFSLSDNQLNILVESENSVSLYYGEDNGVLYEYKKPLANKNVLITGNDLQNKNLSGLSNRTLMVFINGRLMQPSAYSVVNDTTLRIHVNYPQNPTNEISIFVANTTRYSGVLNAQEIIDNNNSLFMFGYHHDDVLIFKNGVKVQFNYLSEAQDGVKIQTEILPTDIIEHYTIGTGSRSFHFVGGLGFLTFGPQDFYNQPLPSLHNAIVQFDDLASLLIDNLRQGYFIKERVGDGVMIVVSSEFDHTSLNCLTIRPFSKFLYTHDEYYVTVPDCRSILHYLSAYDLTYKLIPEMLSVFQKTLLNEVYDEVKRVKDMRNIHKVDSVSIDRLIKLLGFDYNINDLGLRQRRLLLSELSECYRIVGTYNSYNFVNIMQDTTALINMEQLFTPKTDGFYNPPGGWNRTYVSFKSRTDLGGERHVEFVIPQTDYGSVSMGTPLSPNPHNPFGTNRPDIDYKIVWNNSNPSLPDYDPDMSMVDYVNYGYVTDMIVGRWIEWWDFTRPRDWYPTNHVELTMQIPIGRDFNEFMAEFQDRFYNLASAVLYIHSVVQVYKAGSDSFRTPDNIIQFGISSSHVYQTQKYTLTSDPNRQV